MLFSKIFDSMFFASSLWYFSQRFFLMCQILCRYYIPVSICFDTHILGVQCSITFVSLYPFHYLFFPHILCVQCSITFVSLSVFISHILCVQCSITFVSLSVFISHILCVQCSITFVQMSRPWKKFVTDRHHCFKSGIIPKTEGGLIHISFVTDL